MKAKPKLLFLLTRKCDGGAVLGLASGDFTLADDEGGVESITSVTAGSVNGQYILAVTALTDDDYLVNLAAPDDATTFGYESTGAATFAVTT